MYDSEEEDDLFPSNFSRVASSLDQPSGSVVSGGKEDLYHKYSQLLEQPPESEGILKDFLGRRPTFENYQPTGMQKATAAIMGGVAGLNSGGPAGIAAGQAWRNKPFERQQEEWKQEGQFVDDQVRSADSNRNRQLASMVAQIRQQEMDSNNRYKREAAELVEKHRVEKANADREERIRAAKEREKDRDFDREDRQLSRKETERHNRASEARNSEDKLDPYQKAGLRTFERNSDKGTLLESLGFGEENDPLAIPSPLLDPYGEPLQSINQLTTDRVKLPERNLYKKRVPSWYDRMRGFL
jgi:hypothetical protein